MDVEIAKPEGYKNIPPAKGNAILRKMVEKLGPPARVERFARGIMGTRIDIWDCGCQRIYRAGVGQSAPRSDEIESMKACKKHEGSFGG